MLLRRFSFASGFATADDSAQRRAAGLFYVASEALQKVAVDHADGPMYSSSAQTTMVFKRGDGSPHPVISLA
jgi:hypothetical protein